MRFVWKINVKITAPIVPVNKDITGLIFLDIMKTTSKGIKNKTGDI